MTRDDREGRAEWLEDGEVAASLEHHRLRLATPRGPMDAVGISAVHTVPASRGRGHASALVRRVAADALHGGAGAALLFSDIGTGFYSRLGFREVSAVTWSARVAALPSSAMHLSPTEDVAALLALYERSWTPDFVRIARTEASWRDMSSRNGCGEAHLVDDEAYVIVHRSDDVLWIDDAASVGPPREALWSAMRELATRAGAARIGGWLRPDLAGGPFVAQRRERCIPMLTPTDPEDRWHFAWLDHF